MEVSFAKEPYKKDLYFAKETYIFREPTTRCHPIARDRTPTDIAYLQISLICVTCHRRRIMESHKLHVGCRESATNYSAKLWKWYAICGICASSPPSYCLTSQILCCIVCSVCMRVSLCVCAHVSVCVRECMSLCLPLKILFSSLPPPIFMFLLIPPALQGGEDS